MSDDLVKRLRETTHMYQVDCELKMKCADRIEELEERLEAATEDAKEAEAYAGELEAVFESIKAKMAKAVEALEFYGKLIGEKHECPWHMLSDDFGEKARTTLEELAGGKDE